MLVEALGEPKSWCEAAPVSARPPFKHAKLIERVYIIM
jgi:hypothetical protein